MPLRYLILLLLLAGAYGGCHTASAPAPGGWMTFHTQTVLDNHQGLSGAGRRLVLQPQGTYTEMSYTDIIGRERTRRGTYCLDSSYTILMLQPRRGKAQSLRSVHFQGQQYWVPQEDVPRLATPDAIGLRLTSLRTETPLPKKTR